MNSLKSHFRYNKSQRNGIFFLLMLIVILQGIFFFADFSSDETNAISRNEIVAFQQEMDSLKNVEIEKATPKIYPFNPSFITDYKGHQLGMNLDEIDKLLVFRSQGKYINSTKHFQEITGVNDSLLAKISPYFKFPDWITSKKAKGTPYSKNSVEKAIQKKDINTASAEDLRIINGIGEKLSQRIVDYRTKLQGFSFNDQIFEVWGLNKEVADKVLRYFEVGAKPSIQKINVNTATFKEVLAVVYLDYELTKKIFRHKDEVAEIQSIEELKKIDGFPLEKFGRIALYLEAK